MQTGNKRRRDALGTTADSLQFLKGISDFMKSEPWNNFLFTLTQNPPLSFRDNTHSVNPG